MENSLDNAPCGYLTFNDQGKIVEVNQTLCKMSGYTKDELLDQKFEILLNMPGKIFFQTHFFPMLKMQLRADEIFLDIIGKDSGIIPVVTNSVRNEHSDPVMNSCVFLAVHNRRKFEDELIAAKRLSEESLFQNKELIKLRAEADMHARELDRKIQKLQAVNEEMLQFSNFINHDMQECIRKIITFTKLAQKEDPTDYLPKIASSAGRLKSINHFLSTFLTLGYNADRNSRVDLNACLQEALKEVNNKLNFSGLKIESGTLPTISGRFEEFQLLFEQLIQNSVQSRKNDQVNVRVSAVTYEGNIYRHLEQKYEYDEFAEITFNDDGKGFGNASKKHTATSSDQLNFGNLGEGIGIFLCRKIVDNYNGEIKISSGAMDGTQIKIILPVKS